MNLCCQSRMPSTIWQRLFSENAIAAQMSPVVVIRESMT